MEKNNMAKNMDCDVQDQVNEKKAEALVSHKLLVLLK